MSGPRPGRVHRRRIRDTPPSARVVEQLPDPNRRRTRATRRTIPVEQLAAAREAWRVAAPRLTPIVFERYGRLCVLCGAAQADSVDHVVALSQGGDPLDVENLRPACQACNYARGDKPFAAFIAERHRQQLESGARERAQREPSRNWHTGRTDPPTSTGGRTDAPTGTDEHAATDPTTTSSSGHLLTGAHTGDRRPSRDWYGTGR